MTAKPRLLVTAADLAPQALALLTDFDVVYAGKTPTEDDIVALCRQHDPVAIIVRYSKVGAAAMDAAPSLKVISKHGSGTDTIDKPAAAARGIQVVAAAGANAAAVAEHAHDREWEVLAALESEGIFTTKPGGKEAQVTMGDGSIAVVPPSIRHAFQPSARRRTLGIQVYAPPGPEQRFKKLAAK